MNKREIKFRKENPLSNGADPKMWGYSCCSLCGLESWNYLGMSVGTSTHLCNSYFAYVSFSYPSKLKSFYILNWESLKWKLFGIKKKYKR